MLLVSLGREDLVEVATHRAEVIPQVQAVVATLRAMARVAIRPEQVEVATHQAEAILQVRAMVVARILAMPCAYLP